MELKYIPYKNIDKLKWDNCINTACNKLIYAESVYLDHLSANWDAIVLNDYEAVLPLTWKKKLGIRYLYQPAFFQQGGIFSKKKLSPEIITDFIELAASKFKFAEITFNYLHNPPHKISFYQSKQCNNYFFQLGKSYSTIFKQFSPYIKKRLKRLEKFKLIYRKSDNYKEAIKIYKELYNDKLPDFKKSDYDHFGLLCDYYSKNSRIIVRKVYDQDENTLLACVLLLKDENRIYNIASSVFPEGKRKLANYFLYNAVINEFSNEKLILDFEGSDIPGIAYFYKKWASENQQYTFIKWNLLPGPIKLFKS